MLMYYLYMKASISTPLPSTVSRDVASSSAFRNSATFFASTPFIQSTEPAAASANLA